MKYPRNPHYRNAPPQEAAPQQQPIQIVVKKPQYTLFDVAAWLFLLLMVGFAVYSIRGTTLQSFTQDVQRSLPPEQRTTFSVTTVATAAFTNLVAAPTATPPPPATAEPVILVVTATPSPTPWPAQGGISERSAFRNDTAGTRTYSSNYCTEETPCNQEPQRGHDPNDN